MKFRKKPVVVEAMKFVELGKVECKYGLHTEHNSQEISDFIGQPLHVRVNPNGKPEGKTVLIIKTLEGDMEASLGDWIIKGVNGEFYPCKPDIFEKTYEPA